MKTVRLPLTFDAPRLAAELSSIGPHQWVKHFNTGGYEGDWSGRALRAVDGDAGRIYPDPTAVNYADTPVLERLPYAHEVMAAFQCPLTSVRFLKLAAGSNILEHCDLRLSSHHGEARIHVPVVTNDDVTFFLDGERVPMAEGEVWYLDLELPHRVENRSPEDRVHLVIDCVVNDWLRPLLVGDGAAQHATLQEASQVEGPLVTRPLVLPCGLATTIVEFIRSVGLEVVGGDVPHGSALPGVTIDRGRLVVDADRLRHPGDLLHEAGHLAVIGPARRGKVSGSAGTDGAEEMMAIAWSYAAAVAIGIQPAVVFHDEGYRGGSQSLLGQFADGAYLALPMLQWLGMAYDDRHAAAHGVAAFPAMLRWVRTQEAPDPPT